MQQRQASRLQIMEAIEGYLRDRPEAADSVEGVAHWWLRESGLHASLDEVREALDALERKGAVKSQVMLDGRLIYRAGGRQRPDSPGD
jgi:hypothetical protein